MRVALSQTKGVYPSEPPFNPSEDYPEYRGEVSQHPNHVYGAVRENFRLLEYDIDNYGLPSWNPLDFLIEPGNRVFVKPNLVASEYRLSCKDQRDLYTTITHPSVVRAVGDYAALALEGDGELIIGDNPSIDANFERLCDATSYDSLPDFYEQTFGIKSRVLDLRPYVCEDLRDYGFRSRMKKQIGDPEGFTVLNLGRESLFYGLPPLLFRGIYSKRWDTIRRHHRSTQEYGISNSILSADVYISIPKLKTHRKVGVTLNLKGLVGINAEKDFLIHWRIGYPALGGDEYPPPPRLRDYPILIFRHLLNDLVPEKFYLWLRNKVKGTPLEDTFQTEKSPSGRAHRGAWEGNDSCWRMVGDLYKLFLEDVLGVRKKKVRTYSVVDGVISGDGDGPFCPSEKPTNLIISGEKLLAVDLVSARLMDMDISRVRYLVHLVKEQGIKLDEIAVVSDDLDTSDFFEYDRTFFMFRPAKDWDSLIEWRKRIESIGDHTSSSL